MAAQSPRIRGLIALWAAHRELSTLEWLEFQQTVIVATGWIACAAIGSLVAWLALNGAVLIIFRDQPLKAALAIAVFNLLGAAIAGWRARCLLRHPFFALTKLEASRDVDTLLKVIS